MTGFVSRLPHFLQPAYVDEARSIVQTPIFRSLLDRKELDGACLNAGAGELLYFEFLSSFPSLDPIYHVDLTLPEDLAVRGNARHRSRPGSLTNLPFADGVFRFVFCTEVLEHIDDDGVAVGEIARVLGPRGIALISTPSPPAPCDPNHVREGYTLKEMTALLSLHGLTVIDHRFSFHMAFRALYKTWSFLYSSVGSNRSSMMPRALLRTWAHLDRRVPMGKPWDLAVLARKA